VACQPSAHAAFRALLSVRLFGQARHRVLSIGVQATVEVKVAVSHGLRFEANST
jgi:hypothetical protein